MWGFKHGAGSDAAFQWVTPTLSCILEAGIVFCFNRSSSDVMLGKVPQETSLEMMFPGGSVAALTSPDSALPQQICPTSQQLPALSASALIGVIPVLSPRPGLRTGNKLLWVVQDTTRTRFSPAG